MSRVIHLYVCLIALLRHNRTTIFKVHNLICLTCIYTRKPITTIKTVNIHIILPNFLMPPCSSSFASFLPCLPQMLKQHQSFCHYRFVCISKVLCKWNHIVCTLFLSAFFHSAELFRSSFLLLCV